MDRFPYWDIPFATDIVPRQVEFKKNMALLNDKLNACIGKALENRKPEDTEALQNRDYSVICPLEGYRADPGKIPSHFPSLNSGDHVHPL